VKIGLVDHKTIALQAIIKEGERNFTSKTYRYKTRRSIIATAAVFSAMITIYVWRSRPSRQAGSVAYDATRDTRKLRHRNDVIVYG